MFLAGLDFKSASIEVFHGRVCMTLSFHQVLTQAISRNSSNLKVVQLLKLYQDQLRVEESKLILLRKLKESVVSFVCSYLP